MKLDGKKRGGIELCYELMNASRQCQDKVKSGRVLRGIFTLIEHIKRINVDFIAKDLIYVLGPVVLIRTKLN